MSHAPQHETQPGQVVADCYRIETLLGRGAMGAVWGAVHIRLASPVAIKFLNPAIANDPEMLERFMREAQSAAAVRSTHVVQIFDYGVDQGIPYIAMERLVGEALDARLASRGALEPEELDKVFGEVARAVHNAHDLGVIHRDIKPANIFIAREGGHEVTKVLDFGIAKLMDHNLSSPAGSGTNTGIIIGTPNYMSPEQARGQRNVDHRADLWSLAVLAFECLTGRQPFESTSIGDLVVQICTSDPLVPSSIARVPLGFDAWFLRGVRKEIEARYASALEMADALHDLFAAEGRAASSRPRSSSSSTRVHELTQPAPNATKRDPGSSKRTVPDRITSTESAVATEVLSPKPAPPRRRHRAFGIGVVILALIGVAMAFVPGWTRVDPAVDSPVPSASGDTPSRSAPAPAEVPSPVSPDPPAYVEPKTTAEQPPAPEAPGAAEPATVRDDSVVGAAIPPVDTLPSRVPASEKRPRRHAPKPAQQRAGDPVAAPPKTTVADPFSDRL